MQCKQLASDSERSFAVVLDSGDEVVESLLAFARDHDFTAGRLTGLGALSGVVLGFFDLERKTYDRIEINEQVELVALIGGFATFQGEVQLHAHVVVAKRDGTAHGGHLLEAIVRPTLEVVVVDSPAHLRREVDPATNLPLIRI